MRAVIQAATLPKGASRNSIQSGPAVLESPVGVTLPHSSYSWSNIWRRSSSLLYRAAFHGLLLLLLAWIAVVDRGEKKATLAIRSSRDLDSAVDDKLETFEVRSTVPNAETETLASASLSENIMSSASSPQASATSEAFVMSTLGATMRLPKVGGYESMVGAFAPWTPLFATSSLQGRSPENRTKLALSNGGSEKSEKAVEAALVWLAKHQHRDGGWSTYFNDPLSPCQGVCTHGSTERLDSKRFAATGLALLSFLGAGYTHQEGKYKDEVYRGLMFLMDHIKNGPKDAIDPRFPGQFSSSLSKHQMYEQGIATLAICEAYQMTHDPLLKKSCQRAIDFISAAQHYDGSWGYFPKTPGDLSIVGWQMMSLKSAHSSELDINTGQIQWVDKFLNSQQAEGGAKFGYRGTRPTPSMTAIGLLMRLYRGLPRSDPRMIRGAMYIADTGPSRSDIYMNYYATQTLFQLNSLYWPKWNTKLREYLIQSQNQIGHEAGSWYFEDDARLPSNSVGGRLYCTALAAMTLEVYYRYMPIYLDVNEQPFEF